MKIHGSGDRDVETNHHRISYFSMPEDIVNHNNTTNPHLKWLGMLDYMLTNVYDLLVTWRKSNLGPTYQLQEQFKVFLIHFLLSINKCKIKTAKKKGVSIGNALNELVAPVHKQIVHRKMCIIVIAQLKTFEC